MLGVHHISQLPQQSAEVRWRSAGPSLIAESSAEVATAIFWLACSHADTWRSYSFSSSCLATASRASAIELSICADALLPRAP